MMNWTKVISTLTAGLVLILALMAFALSYASLRHLAGGNGVGPGLDYVWPLLLDFAMVVFSLAILRASLRGERAAYAWLLTLTFGAMATAANVFDVTTFGLPPVYVQVAVKALPPVALVLTFELLMSMVKADVRQAGAVQSLAELTVEQREIVSDLSIKRQELAKLDAEIKLRREQAQAEIVFKTEVDAPKMDVVRAAKGDDITARRLTLVNILSEQGDIGPTALAEELTAVGYGCTRGTVYNDLKALNADGVLCKNGNGWEVSNG